MFRILKISKLNRLKFNGFHRYGSTQSHLQNSNEEPWQKQSFIDKFDDYFSNNGRYKVFRKDSVILHQFDDETHNLTEWHRPKSTNIPQWNNLPNTATNGELIQAFEEMISYSISHDINLTDPMFDCFVDEFTESVEQFTTNELVRAIQLFARASLDKNLVLQRNYIELYIALDQAITVKAANLLPGQLLYFNSVWKCIPLAKKSFFSKCSGRLFNRHFKVFNGQQLCQALFYINSLNRPIDDIRDFENVFENVLNEINLQELATVLWTFDRTDKINKIDLKNKLYDYLENQDLSQLDETFLLRIVNTIAARPPGTKEQSNQLRKLMTNISKTLDQRSLHFCVLTAHMGVPVRIFNELINSYLFDRCLNESLSKLTIRTLENLSRIVYLSPETSEKLMKVSHLILDEAKKRLDVVAQQSYYSNFMNIIRNLLIRNVYDLELLNNILRPDYIKFMNNSKQLEPTMYEIDGYARINLKNIYHGHILPNDFLQRTKYIVDYIPDQVNRFKKSEQFIYNVENATKRMFSFYNFAHAVAHHRYADIFICINKNTLESVDVKENYPTLYTGKSFDANTLTNNANDLMVFALVVGNMRDFASKEMNNESVPVGYMKMKIDQLKILGFHPIWITWKEADGNLERYIVSKMNNKLKKLGMKEIQIQNEKNAEI